MRAETAQAMRDIFNSHNLQAARSTVREVGERFAIRAPEFVNWLEANIEERLVIYAFPRSHRKRIRTTNGLERINRELKRRIRVAVMFPNQASALRLITGVLIEIHEDWITGRRYPDMSDPEEGEIAA